MKKAKRRTKRHSRMKRMMDTVYKPFMLLVSFDGIEIGTRDETKMKTTLSWAGRDLKALKGTPY